MSYKKAVAGQIRPGRKEIVQDRRRKKGKLVFLKGMFPKIVGFPPKSSILIGFSIYFHHPLWGSPIFGNPLWLLHGRNHSNYREQTIPAWLVGPQMVVTVRESSHEMPLIH